MKCLSLSADFPLFHFTGGKNEERKITKPFHIIGAPMQISQRNCHARDSIGRDVPRIQKVPRVAKTRKSLKESSEAGLCGTPTARGFLCLRRSLFPTELPVVFASQNYRQSSQNHVRNSATLGFRVCLKMLFGIVDRGIEILVFYLSKRLQLYFLNPVSGYSRSSLTFKGQRQKTLFFSFDTTTENRDRNKCKAFDEFW